MTRFHERHFFLPNKQPVDYVNRSVSVASKKGHYTFRTDIIEYIPRLNDVFVKSFKINFLPCDDAPAYFRRNQILDAEGQFVSLQPDIKQNITDCILLNVFQHNGMGGHIQQKTERSRPYLTNKMGRFTIIDEGINPEKRLSKTMKTEIKNHFKNQMRSSVAV